MKKNDVFDVPECAYNLLAVRDTMNVLSGKWIVPIIGILRLYGNMHFKDLMDRLPGISAKVLTSSLREMEINLLVSRTILDTRPVKVEYAIPPYGETLEKLIFEMMNWGLIHRTQITGKNTLTIAASDYVLQLQNDLPIR